MFLETAALEVELLPEIGGKIGQIRDKVSGHAFLVPPQKPYRRIPPGERWIEYDTSGMDDCFPNIAEGPYPLEPWKDRPLPQLGEWVYGSWEVVKANEHEVVLERGGVMLPYRARKTVRFADERTLELSYQVENQSDFPFRYMWAAHPLIATGEEFELTLPAGEKHVVKFPHDGQVHRWPYFGAVDLSRQWIPRGRTLKIFVSRLDEGWCELRFTGHKVRFSFDQEAAPVVGIWFNNFGFPPGGAYPFRCIAVEPCTSPTDLMDALEPSAYPVVADRTTSGWRMQVRLE